MTLIAVALTWYPPGTEKTIWVNWTHIPPLGATVHLDDNTPPMYVRNISVVPDDWPRKDDGDPLPGHWARWHLEVWLDERMPT